METPHTEDPNVGKGLYWLMNHPEEWPNSPDQVERLRGLPLFMGSESAKVFDESLKQAFEKNSDHPTYSSNGKTRELLKQIAQILGKEPERPRPVFVTGAADREAEIAHALLEVNTRPIFLPAFVGDGPARVFYWPKEIPETAERDMLNLMELEDQFGFKSLAHFPISMRLPDPCLEFDPQERLLLKEQDWSLKAYRMNPWRDHDREFLVGYNPLKFDDRDSRIQHDLSYKPPGSTREVVPGPDGTPWHLNQTAAQKKARRDKRKQAKQSRRQNR